jgi:hypothetical protein
MVEPITSLIIISILFGVLFWPYIMEFFTSVLIPFVHEHMDKEIADLLKELVMFLDDAICPVRQKLVESWGAFTKMFKEIRTTFTKISPDMVTATTEVKTFDNKNIPVPDQNVPWYKLPTQVRDEMINKNVKRAELDQRKAIEARMKQKCDEKGINIQELVN